MEIVQDKTSEPTVKSPEQGATNTSATQTSQSDDLISRVSAFQKNNDSVVIDSEPSNSDDSHFDLKEIESMNDPVAKEQAMKAYKSFQRGFNQKFQELSMLRKEMEGRMNNGLSGEWTPERVQALANDPKFVEAARQVAGTPEGSADPLEYADEGVKSVITSLKTEVDQLKVQNKQAFEQQNQVLRQQQHRELQTKYSDYNPQKIDEITVDMLNGKIQPTPEHIYKAFNYEDAVKKGYMLGRKDERDGVQTKMESASIEGTQTQASVPAVTPEVKETDRSFWNRIVDKNLALAKSRAQ